MPPIKQTYTAAELALADWRLPVRGAEAVCFCAKHHIKALQLDFGGQSYPQLDNYQTQKIIDACLQYKVRITAIAGNQLNHVGLGSQFDHAGDKEIKKIIISILDIAHRLAVPLVFFPSFHAGIIREQATLMRAAKMLRWACQEALDRQLLLGSENDVSIAWSKQLFTEVDAPNFCLIFDCYNYFKAGHSVINLLSQMNGYFASQVHIKDTLNNSAGYAALGNGDGELIPSLTALSQLNWVEYYVLENDYRHCNYQQLSDDISWISNQLVSRGVNLRLTNAERCLA